MAKSSQVMDLMKKGLTLQQATKVYVQSETQKAQAVAAPKTAKPSVPSGVPTPVKAPKVEPTVIDLIQKGATLEQATKMIVQEKQKMALQQAAPAPKRTPISIRPGPSRTTYDIKTIRQFSKENPGASVPEGPVGNYDQVRIITRVNPLSPQVNPFMAQLAGPRVKIPPADVFWEFSYSPRAKHKINVAGSVKNYDQFLQMVRRQPELGALHMFAGPLNIDLAMASNEPTIAGGSEREEILIKQLHRWRGTPAGEPTIERAAGAIIENPFVQLALIEAVAAPVGKVLTGVGGKIAATYGPRGVQAFRLAQIGVGGTLAAPSVIDIAEDVKSGRVSEAVPKGVMLGLQIGAGIEGYKIGASAKIGRGPYKGLTSFEKGFLKNVDKSRWMNPTQKDMTKTFFKFQRDVMSLTPEQRARIDNVSDVLNFENVEYFKDFNGMKQYAVKAIKNLNKATPSEVYGGAGQTGKFAKLSTHDIDIAFKHAKNVVELKYVISRLGYDPAKVFDIHKLPRVGQQIEFLGWRKAPSVTLESGVKKQSIIDQLMRTGQGSVVLEHTGRGKDLTNTVRVANILMNEAYPKGLPAGVKTNLANLTSVYTAAAKNPATLVVKEPALIYGSGRVWKAQQKFYERVLPESYLHSRFTKLTGLPETVTADELALLTARPVISPSVRMPSLPGGISSTYLLNMLLSSRNILDSSSVFGPTGISPYSPGIDRSSAYVSSTGKYVSLPSTPSPPPPSTPLPSTPSPPSPPPPSSGYSPSSPPPPSPPPPSSPYPSVVSPSSSILKRAAGWPFPLLGPAGADATRKSMKRMAVQYYNELEATRQAVLRMIT